MNQKKCVICKDKFEPRNSMQKLCSPICAIKFAKQQEAKRKRDFEREFNAETRRRKAKLKTASDYAKEAQATFNRYIRLRDEKEPCISCQRHHKGQYHAGHYRTVKAAPQHRYNPLNVHKQCSACNAHLSGNITEFRINLVRKIGQERVEQIENANHIHRYSIEELQRIKRIYAKKFKLYSMKFRC